MAYCTAQDVIDCCVWPAFGQVAPTVQSDFIDCASEKIDEVTRRTFGLGQQSVTETFDGDGNVELMLSLRPVVSVALVTVDGDPLDNTDGTAWTLRGASGRLIRGDGRGDSRFALRWPAGSDNIGVQYWGGYADLPKRIVRATAWLVRYFYDQGMISGAVSQESIGGYTRSLREVALSAGVPPHVMGLIEGFVQDDAFV